MPIVPTYREQQVQSSPLPNNGFSVQSNPNQFGADLGQVGEQYTGVFAEARQRANVALAQDASLQLRQKANELMNDPRNGLLSLQGKSAIGKGYEFEQTFDQSAGEISGTLQDDAVKQMFMQQVQEMRLQFSSQANRHEMGQIKSYEQEQFQSTLTLNAESAAGLYGDNQAYISANKQVFNQIEEFGFSHGWSDEQILAKKQEFKLATAKRTVENQIGADYMQFLQQNGEPSSLTGSIKAPSNTAHKVRGERNNNPGNIRKSKDNWVGQTGNDGEFVTFATPAHGIRATGKNLLSYARQGYVTPEQIITRWAPPEDDNDTPAYIEYVSNYLDVPADQPLDLTDLNTLTRLSMAIMIKENGQRSAESIAKEDITSGIQSALGLVELPAATQVPKRLTGSAAFDALDASDQAKYLKQAEQMDKQRQQQLQLDLGTRVSDAYAAWENGLDAPNAPSQNEIIAAYGFDKSIEMVADMKDAKQYAGRISAAKEMTSQAQYSLLQKTKPDPAEPNYASKLQRWEKFGKFVDNNIKTQDKVFAANRLQLSIQNNFPLDPNDKENQNAADSYFSQNLEAAFNLKDEASLNAVAELASRTGLIPSQIKSIFNTGSTSKDPAIVLPIAKMYGQIFDNNPAAATEIPTSTMAYYSKVYDLTRSGMSDDKAVETAYRLTYEQDDRTKQMIASQIREKDYIKKRDKAAQSNVDDFVGFFEFSPKVDKPGTANREYSRDYQTLFDANFADSGGDIDLAKKITNAQIKKRWGVTTINGDKEVMRYAPEAVYGLNESGAGNWVEGQWQEEKKQLESTIFGGLPKDSNIILVPDAHTSRDYSYAIMIKQTGSDDIPTYKPLLGDNGQPSRFVADQRSSPMYREVMREKRKSVEKARAQREGWTYVDPDNPAMKVDVGLIFNTVTPIEPDPRQQPLLD